MSEQLEKPLAIDLYCGLGGWTEGLLAEGYWVVGFDNVRHMYGDACYPAQLVLQDVLTIHGRQFKDAALIVGSSPCQEFSYRAMPWKRAKAMPPPDLGIALFQAQFRIQREASTAAGRHIPMVVENVRGAIPWVGRSRWNFGSFHLWGDVPALMPMTQKVMKNSGGSWFGIRGNNPVKRNDPRDAVKAPGQDWNRYAKTGEVSPDWKMQGQKTVAHLNRRDGHRSIAHLTNPAEHGRDHIKGGDYSLTEKGFNVAAAERYGSQVQGVDYRRTPDDKRQHVGVKRKFASAMIAKIPLPLARHIGRVYYPLANVKI